MVKRGRLFLLCKLQPAIDKQSIPPHLLPLFL
jgi:hypothetical protein